MPWYRSGQVAITAGQTTVTGTSTNFALNARVGDAFQGPDGRWYEVANIASASVLSILPAYQGSTVTAGSYGIAPMQGYVKDAADSLRQLVNQWGTTLASLGSVSTESVVPVAKGGTGGTTQADARAGLGLTLTSSSTDSTAGRVTKVGDYGWGSEQVGPDERSVDVKTSRAFRMHQDATGPNLGTLVGINLQRDPSRAAQVVLADATNSLYWMTRNASGVDQPWRRSLSNADLSGTVTQVSGAPTGAIIERGTNGNGSYTKFADGTMICWRRDEHQANMNVAAGALFTGSSIPTLPMPAAFVSTPTVTVYVEGGAVPIMVAGQALSTNSLFAQCVPFTVNQQGLVSMQVMRIAVGRWF